MFSETILKVYNFSQPQLKPAKDGYTEIVYSDCKNYGKEGTPLLPYKSASILLTQGQEIAGIEVVSVEYYPPQQNISIKPASRPFPLSKPDKDYKNYKVVPEAAIYTSMSPFPEKNVTGISTGYLSGHSIGHFNICPLTYTPGKKEVRFIKSITISIKTTESSTAKNSMLRNTSKIYDRISKIVDNPQKIKTYSYPSAKSGTEYDILLITNTDLLPAFSEYITFKESTGFYVKTVTTDSIYSTYSGADEQTKIRNCIIDYYQNYGISYVILGGDADPNNPADKIIPHRGLYVSSYYEEEDIPADIYYSNLDGNWNDDENSYWGEPGEEDFYPEVSVGRICVDNETEIQNFTHKLIMYQNSPVIADIEKALMLGEDLGWSVTGSDFKEEVRTGSSNFGYTTAGISDNFTVSTLYDTDMYSWEISEVFDQYNNTGINLLNHLGHSNVDYNMKMYNSDLTTTNFQNDGITRGFVIGYSQGCYNGSFDNRGTSPEEYSEEDCFAEKITTIETGDVACIGNSRYGWGNLDNTDGPSQFFDRLFFDAIFGQGITAIGDANNYSKESNVSFIELDPVKRWCDYEINLFGDPSMDIWTADPTPIIADYPDNVPLGIGEITFQTDAPFARIGLMQNNSIIGRGIANADGDVTVQLIAPVSSVDTIKVSIIAHNRIRHHGFILVTSVEPYVCYSGKTINDASGNSNGLAEYGESILLSLKMKNYGQNQANNVNVTISTTNPHINITDSTQNYGNIAGNTEKNITNGFSFAISDSVPDNSSVCFSVKATDGNSIWKSFFSISVYAPELKAGNVIISDISGNNNGRLDPGETVDIIVPVTNSGHCDAVSTTANLSTSNNNITINNASYNLNTINAGTTKNAVFNITVSPDAQIGELAGFSFTAESGHYKAAKTFDLTIGLIVEDWETGDFNKFPWDNQGNIPWIITNDNPYEGSYSAKTGTISDYGDYSELSLGYYHIIKDDSISFYTKISCEEYYDYLIFYIDSNIVDYWSGEENWQRVSYPVSKGNHTFKWVYTEEGYYPTGNESAWLDFIVLPSKLKVSKDAGVSKVISPVSAKNLTDNETLTVEIVNFGEDTITNFPVSYKIDDGNAITDTVTETIYPGNKITYSFNTPMDMSDTVIYNITAYTSLAGDTINDDDTVSVAIEHIPPSYCEPYSYCDWGNIDKFSLKSINNTDSICNNGGYHNFTSMNTTLYKGGSYNVYISSSSGPEYASLWIDFNDNYEFDESELMVENLYLEKQDTIYKQLIEIPETAVNGPHRLRVRTSYYEYIDPCEDYYYGEIQDYTVIIADPVSKDVGISAVVSPVSAKTLGNNETVTVTVENYGDSIISNIPVNYIINDSAVITDTIINTIPAFDRTDYSFDITADLSAIGLYNIKAYTSLAGDTINDDDTMSVAVEHMPPVYCEPYSYCFYGNINKFSLKSINNTDTICNGGGYHNFTSINTTLYKGGSYNVHISSSTGPEHASLWIDFNDNYEFGESELLLENLYLEEQDTIYKQLIEIPETAVNGPHRLRVRTNYYEYVDPCENYYYGETQDYTVIIADPVSKNVGISAVVSPVSGKTLGNDEIVTVTVENYGDSIISNIPVNYVINGGSVITETVSNTIPAYDRVDYSFIITADLSAIGLYNIKAYTSLTGDTIYSDDTISVAVEHIAPSYCTPYSNCSYGVDIDNFSLNTINQSSTGCSQDGYADYTDISTTLHKDSSYNMTVSTGYGYSYIYLWIDFDDDYEFEGSELLVSDLYVENAYVDYNDTVTIPSSADSGAHRMRVKLNYWMGNDPCSGDWGEIHDYTAIIDGGNTIKEISENVNIKIYPNPSDGIVYISVNEIKENTELYISDAKGQIIYKDLLEAGGKEYTKKFDFSGYSKGMYFIKFLNTGISKVEKLVIY